MIQITVEFARSGTNPTMTCKLVNKIIGEYQPAHQNYSIILEELAAWVKYAWGKFIIWRAPQVYKWSLDRSRDTKTQSYKEISDLSNHSNTLRFDLLVLLHLANPMSPLCRFVVNLH